MAGSFVEFPGPPSDWFAQDLEAQSDSVATDFPGSVHYRAVALDRLAAALVAVWTAVFAPESHSSPRTKRLREPRS